MKPCPKCEQVLRLVGSRNEKDVHWCPRCGTLVDWSEIAQAECVTTADIVENLRKVRERALLISRLGPGKRQSLPLAKQLEQYVRQLNACAPLPGWF